MESLSPPRLENAIIVAAHPDDEVLWFSSVLKQVPRAIIVFRRDWRTPGIGDRRRAAIAAHPHPGLICLDIDESGAFGCGDWERPVETQAGLVLGWRARRRSLTLARRRLSGRNRDCLPAEMSVDRAYAANAERIEAALRPHLAPGSNVFTHNPWGEYGHEEHVQVFRVVERLRREIGFRQLMTNYVSERALPLAMRYLRAEAEPFMRLPTDAAYGEEIAAVYRKAGCWTWADRWAWFEDECIMEVPAVAPAGGPYRRLSPLNLLSIGRAGRPRGLFGGRR